MQQPLHSSVKYNHDHTHIIASDLLLSLGCMVGECLVILDHNNKVLDLIPGWNVRPFCVECLCSPRLCLPKVWALRKIKKGNESSKENTHIYLIKVKLNIQT